MQTTFTARVDLAGFQRPEVGADLQSAGRRVDLAQNGALAEEERLLGVDDDVVEVAHPVAPVVRLLQLQSSQVYC